MDESIIRKFMGLDIFSKFEERGFGYAFLFKGKDFNLIDSIAYIHPKSPAPTASCWHWTNDKSGKSGWWIKICDYKGLHKVIDLEDVIDESESDNLRQQLIFNLDYFK